ncbi:MAG: ATP-binding SpoIIE family protein phosphatase, partial [Candidatus Eiseniibacteriota bacterium]
LTPRPAPARLGPGERLLASRDLLVVESPVMSVAGQRLGTAWLGVRRAVIERAVTDARRTQTIFLATLMTLGVGGALLLISVLLRPIVTLRAGLERIGRGDLDTPLAVGDRTELGLLAEAVNDMASALKAAQHEALEKERLAREVEIAREIQRRLLPAGAHECGDVLLTGWHRAAAEVGGDYYDILPLADGRVAFAIADVAGKGLGGCLVMSMLSALLKALHAQFASPAELLVGLESRLEGTLRRGEFITIVYGVLDPRSGQVRYANAGHPPLLLHRAAGGRVESLGAGGIPIGALRGDLLARTLQDQTCRLEPGDLLVLLTDGFHEAIEPEREEQLGLERITGTLARHAPGGAAQVIEGLSEAVSAWSDGPPLDDATLLVIERRAEGVRAAAGSDAVPTTATILPFPERARLRGAGDLDPLTTLRLARDTGVGLTLPADLGALRDLGDWLRRCPGLRELASGVRGRLETALYEVCANVIEHGYAKDSARHLDLWWVPDALGSTPVGAIGDPAETVRRGCFVVRDHGRRYQPPPWSPVDFSDPDVRRRGRGLGRDIVHRTMRDVVHHPETQGGNLTFLTFDPAAAGEDPGDAEEARYA